MKKALIFALAIFAGQSATAQDSYNITIKDHKFTPTNLEIPANQKVKLVVENQDSTVEEFESYELHREKIIKGKSKAIIFIGPLKADTYKYFGEFNQDTAQGTITAK